MDRLGKNVVLKPRHAYDSWQADEEGGSGGGPGALVGRLAVRTLGAAGVAAPPWRAGRPTTGLLTRRKALTARTAAAAAEGRPRGAVSLKAAKAAVGSIRKAALGAAKEASGGRERRQPLRAGRPTLQPRGAVRPEAELRRSRAAQLRRQAQFSDEASDGHEEEPEEGDEPDEPPSPAASLLSVGSSVIADVPVHRGGVTTAAPVTPLPADFSPEPASDEDVRQVRGAASGGSASASSPRGESRGAARRKAMSSDRGGGAGARAASEGMRGQQQAGRRPLVMSARATVVAATAAAAAWIRAADEPAKPVHKRRIARSGLDAAKAAVRTAHSGAQGSRSGARAAARAAKTDDAEPMVRKKRRTTKTRGAAGTEAAAVAGAGAVARHGAAAEPGAGAKSMLAGEKRQAGATRGKAAAAKTMAKGSVGSSPGQASTAPSDELTEEEQRELKEAVLEQLQKAICADREDAVVLADFICVLVDQHKTRAEMTTELAFFHEEAEPFVAWVEERKAEILTRRQAMAAAQRSIRRRLAASSGGSPADSGSAAAQRPTPRKLLMTEEVAVGGAGAAKVKAPAAAPAARGQPYVVVTDRLVLQPNPSAVPAAGAAGHASVPGGPSATDRRMELLGEMTKKLQQILAKLADKSLDDAGRERYQAMAQTIQAQLATLSAMGKTARP